MDKTSKITMLVCVSLAVAFVSWRTYINYVARNLPIPEGVYITPKWDEAAVCEEAARLTIRYTASKRAKAIRAATCSLVELNGRMGYPAESFKPYAVNFSNGTSVRVFLNDSGNLAMMGVSESGQVPEWTNLPPKKSQP